MPIDRRLGTFATALALALALAACGTSTPSSGGASAAPAANRTSGPAAAPELAAKLPSSAGGVALVKSSFTGADLTGVAVSLDTSVLESLAKASGKTLGDVQVAEARPADANLGGIVLAIRVPGADPKQIVDATFSKSTALQLATLGGKSVYRVGGSGLNVVVYPKDDVMFQVIGAPSALTEAIIAALP